METFHSTKCSQYSWNVLQSKKHGSFKNCLLKGSLRNEKWFIYSIAVKPTLEPLFLRVEKGYLDDYNVLHTKKHGSFKNCLLIGSLRNQKCFFNDISGGKTSTFATFFMSVLIQHIVAPCFEAWLLVWAGLSWFLAGHVLVLSWSWAGDSCLGPD